MYVVALTRSTAAFEADLALLASWFSLTPYDFGLRARGGLPALLGGFAHASEGDDRVAKLRERGYGAVACDTKHIPGASQQSIPREFQFNDGVLSGVDEAGKSFDLPLSRILALIRATSVVATESSTTTETKKLALGRALATGGLVMRKTVEHTSTSVNENREQVLYLFMSVDAPPLCFRETQLHYQGLGAALKSVTSQNFLTLVEALRAYAPQALYDDRFLRQKRKLGIAAVSAVGKDVSVSISNASDNDLGAYLLVLAHAQGQL